MLKRQRVKRMKDVRKPRLRSFSCAFDHGKPHRLKLYICRDRAHMVAAARLMGVNWKELGQECNGFVQRFFSKTDRRIVTYRGVTVARMFLAADQIRNGPNELVAHECVHAGMSWALFQKASPTKSMENEEVMAYAAGRLNNQIARIGWASGVYDGKF